MGPIDWHTCFFFLVAAIACTAALAVVVTSNIVRMACWLVVSLTAVAGLFFLAGAEFTGAVQLMVYVGGTMVLLIFGVMLTARGPFVSMKIGAGQWVMATAVGAVLLLILLQAAVKTFGRDDVSLAAASSGPARKESAAAADAALASSTEQIGLGLMGVRADRLSQPDRVLRGGMSGYLLPFEIVSVHLVVVLVGAAYLARARRRIVPRHLSGGLTASGVEE